MRELRRRAVDALPHGDSLSRQVLLARHRGILVLLWAHVPLLAVLALTMGQAPGHIALQVAPVVLLAAVASRHPWDRLSRAVAATLGLVTSSAVLIFVSGGYIEAHFHVFVMMAVVALYQHWAPFLGAIAFVAVHHGVLGAVLPGAVFNHPQAHHHPVQWALLHAAFVLAAAFVHVVAWRSSERGAYDSLTGLPGAALLVRRLERALDHGPAAVLYLDFDGFKTVNDHLGHAAGDEVLAAAARRMEAVVREGDTVGRLGGDEFAVVMPGADADAAGLVADRLAAVVAEPFTLREATARIGVSVGVVVAAAGDSAEMVLGDADRAMYRAKQAARTGLAPTS